MKIVLEITKTISNIYFSNGVVNGAETPCAQVGNYVKQC
jgi:hypothetical protein